MAIASADMKHGMQVSTESGTWEVLDRHPNNRTWWLHRWNDAGKWETDYCHEQHMEAVSELSPAVTERATWGRAAFNSFTNGKAFRRMGYVVGKWGVFRGNSGYGWTIYHLPTGLSLPNGTWLDYRSTLADVRQLAELLAAEDFPMLHAAEFGTKPSAEYKTELDNIVSLLTEATPPVMAAA